MNEQHIVMHDWDGEERRSIPVHILNYMDHRLGEHTDRIELLFKEHTTDEMDRYNAILKKLGEASDGSQSRHHALMTQLNIVTENIECIDNAFPRNKEGLPDYDEHHDYHFTWKTRKEWWAGTSNQAVRKLFEIMLIALVLWLGSAIFQATMQAAIK